MTRREAVKVATALASEMSSWANMMIGHPGWDLDRELAPENVEKLQKDIQWYAKKLGGKNK